MRELIVVRLLYEEMGEEINPDTIRETIDRFPENTFSGFEVVDFNLTPDLVEERPTIRTTISRPLYTEPCLNPEKANTYLNGFGFRVLAISPITIFEKKPYSSISCKEDDVAPSARRFYKNRRLEIYGVDGQGYNKVALSFGNSLDTCVHELGHTFGLHHHSPPKSFSPQDFFELGKLHSKYDKGELTGSDIPKKFRCVMGFKYFGPLGTTFCDRHYRSLVKYSRRL